MIRILLICLFSLISSPSLLFAREVVFYHTDNVGSPVAMTDSKGTVVWRANDLPFGEEYQTTENPQHNSRRFIGKEKDKETGLVYIGARYLDPATGRFLQPDPVGPVDSMTGKVNAEMLNNPQRLNRYAYGLNNPYRYIDPDGRMTKDIEDGINPFEMTEGGAPRGGGCSAGPPGTPEPFKSIGSWFSGAAKNTPTSNRAPDFVVTPKGEAIPVPSDAIGPTPTRAPGFQYTGGTGGHGLDTRTTGVRIMEGNANHGPRAVYMNQQGQTINPATGRTVPNSDPAAHHYLDQ